MLCINCERQTENYSGWQDRSGKGDLDQIIDSEAPMGDQRISLFEIETGLSSNR
jgi:hypothetical protein